MSPPSTTVHCEYKSNCIFWSSLKRNFTINFNCNLIDGRLDKEIEPKKYLQVFLTRFLWKMQEI